MADPTLPSSASSPAAIVGQARALWTKLPRRGRIAAIATVVAVLGLVVYLATRTTPGWKPVAQQLSSDDAQELTAVLGNRGIPSRLGAGGKSVEVPESRLSEARIAAASAGLPRGGVGFEVFEGASLGQSSFAEQIKYRRALQGELARSIAALAPVEGARVHVALGKRSVFKDADEPPSASVVLHVRPGQHLDADQVRGVKQLVAASVDGLTADQVVVVDQHGDVLSAEAERAGNEQADIEATTASRVRAMLERVVGSGHVAVVVNAQMDLRKVSSSEEIFDKDRSAVRSESIVAQPGAPLPATSSGIAGVKGNLPGAQSSTGAAPGTAGGDLSETRNYEVTRTVRQIDEAPARIARLHLAILVDYKPGANGAAAAPLPKEQLAELEALARQAAGLDDSRGDKLEIRSIPFAADEDAPAAARSHHGGETWELPVPLPIAAGAAGGVVVVAMVIGFVLWRRRRRRAEAAATPVLALPAPVSEIERVLDGAPPIAAAPALSSGRSLEDRVLAAVKQDVTRSARVLSAWLHEPDPMPAKAK